MMSEDDAVNFQAGVDAFWSCKEKSDNPHPAGSQAEGEWAAGWLNALEEDNTLDDDACDWDAFLQEEDSAYYEDEPEFDDEPDAA